MIGASGRDRRACSGGYVMLYPRARIVTFVRIPFLWHVVDVPAWIFLGIWFVGQFLLPTRLGRRVDGARGRLPGRASALGPPARRARPQTARPPVDVEYICRRTRRLVVG